MGTHNPPNHSSFVLNYGSPVHHVFDTNVVLLPAFLDEGISVRVKHVPENEEQEHIDLGIWKHEKDAMTTAWFVRAGITMEFEIQDEKDQHEENNKKEGVAAVFVYGILTLESACGAHEEVAEKANTEAAET